MWLEMKLEFFCRKGQNRIDERQFLSRKNTTEKKGQWNANGITVELSIPFILNVYVPISKLEY